MMINVYDWTDFPVVKDLRSAETDVIFGELPFFAHFTVKVRALYNDGDDIVESVEISEAIVTGPGSQCDTWRFFRENHKQIVSITQATLCCVAVLPAKPSIAAMMSTSNSSALIRWAKNAHRSLNYTYKIVLNEDTDFDFDIETPNVDYAFIERNLEPDLTYNVTFVTFLTFNGVMKILSIERGEFTMLPQSKAQSDTYTP